MIEYLKVNGSDIEKDVGLNTFSSKKSFLSQGSFSSLLDLSIGNDISVLTPGESSKCLDDYRQRWVNILERRYKMT